MKTSNSHQQQDRLLEATRQFVLTSDDQTVRRLGAPLLAGTLRNLEIPAKDHPAITLLERMQDSLAPDAEGMFTALVEAMASLCWQTSYTTADGFSEFYLNRYAWCDLVGPEGLYQDDQHRIGFGLWHEGLTYPAHAHEPEEIYWILAGNGWFSRDGQPAAIKRPGEVVHHRPNVWHGLEMRDSPLLVLYLWRGENLHRKSSFDRDNQTIEPTDEQASVTDPKPAR